LLAKKVNENYEYLVKKLGILKQDVRTNFTEISQTENILREINDIKINAILEKNKNFDLLHSEKITPFFLKMASGSKQEISMQKILDYNGRTFDNTSEQRDFIRNHFASSFVKPINEPDNMIAEINGFLGDEILNHPLVQNLKLNDTEKLNLDLEISLDELELALEGANNNSAPGIDGINTKFIKRFWFIFKHPLHKYAITVFRKGRLTQSFKSAMIRIIPKKGDATDIRRWRPISLLGCMYKIISRALNNRLKSVINRFTSRAQKGFTQHRYIQEVLINVCEKIAHCKNNNVMGALLSIDQTRAFDTISHNYMTAVLNFFGFGEQFINMLNTISTNRTAAILFEDGSISKDFPLETGKAQGDGPSPLLYNMGEQILLLKIELDSEIASIFQHLLLPYFNLNLIPDPKLKGMDADYNIHLRQESTRETNKADSFADDNSTATLANYICLQKLKENCERFSVFSGLQSNPEKTTLLPMGGNMPLQPEILDLGFSVVNEVNLLGLLINRDLTSLTVHFDNVVTSIQRIAEHWSRFNLTLPGRISVCKTFMLSQIGYLGSIITPSKVQLHRLQKIMDDFCTGNMRIAKRKLYAAPGDGGLGLINLDDFIVSLQCSWVKRVTQHWGDNWRYDIKAKCYGNPLILENNFFNQNDNPILHNIGMSFSKFKDRFYKKDDNYRKAFIFKNPLFTRGQNDNGLLCERFFIHETSLAERKKIAMLKFEDFFVRGGAKTLFELNREYGMNFSLATYMRLHEALQFFANRRRGANVAKPSQSLEFFLKTFVKGSKPYRRILSESRSLDIQTLNTVTSFCNIISANKPDINTLKACWGEWNKFFYTNRCWEFIFKFRNNILGLNSRVSNFVPGLQAECTFCVMNREPYPVMSESFIHLFFDCHYTGRYREIIVARLFPELAGADTNTKKDFWFFSKLPGMTSNNIFINFIVAITNFAIWELKLQNLNESALIFFQNIVHQINRTLATSCKIRDAKSTANFFVCRHTFEPP